MQFRLSTLFLLFIVLWSSLAVFGVAGGTAVFVLVVGLAICIVHPWLIAVMGGLLLLVGLLLSEISCAGAAARQCACMNNMKQIALALHNYCEQYGSLPPPCVYDKSGRPMHSWRVLILPFCECSNVYKQYNLSEPWDGPNNKKLLTDPPPFYACPGDAESVPRGSATSYLAVVGPDSVWPPGQPRRPGDPALDAQSGSTALLIETADSGIAWTEPRDFPADRPGGLQAKDSGLAIRCPHTRDVSYFFHEAPCGAHVATVDMHVRLLPAGNFAADNLKRLLAVGGFTEENMVDGYGNQLPRIHWAHCVALLVWMASAGLLFYRAVRSRIAARRLAAPTAMETGPATDRVATGSGPIAGS